MRHFVAVAEELHFGRAARRLNMVQPALTQSIQRLEADLDVQLLNRSRRSVELTPAGAVFLEGARRTLEQADLARLLACREAYPKPEIRVSLLATALYRLLPPLLGEFRDRVPGVRVRLIEQTSRAQVDTINASRCDVAFVTLGTLGIEECESLVVERAPLVAALPAEWLLAARETVSLAELADLPYILPPPEQCTSLSANTLSLFQKVGVMPYVVQEASHVNTTIGLVGAGLGCTIIAATAALTRPHNVRFVPLAAGGADRLGIGDGVAPGAPVRGRGNVCRIRSRPRPQQHVARSDRRGRHCSIEQSFTPVQ